MLRKRLYVYLYSLKSSVKKKPMALVVLFIAIIIATISCGWATRALVGSIEKNLYETMFISIARDFNYDEGMSEFFSLREKGVFGVDSRAELSGIYKDVEITNKDSETIISSGSIHQVIFESEYITEKQIIDKEQIIVVNEFFLQEVGAEIGDEIIISGSKFTIFNAVVEDYDNDQSLIYMPYSAEIANRHIICFDDEGMGVVESEKNTYSYIRIYAYNMQRVITNAEKGKLASLGVIAKPYSFITASEIWVIIAMILFASINIINIMTIIKYWLKVNDKKYSIFKIVGAKPTQIAGAMVVEGSLSAILGVIVGLICEHYLHKLLMPDVILQKFLYLHYIVLLSIVLMAVFIPLIIRVIKRIKVKAIDRTMYV